MERVRRMKLPLRFACAVLALILVVWVVPTRLGAQDPDRTSNFQTDDHHAAEVADRQPTQPLAPMVATPCINGLAGSYPCKNVDLLSFLPLSSLGGGQANSLWGWTDSQTGKEYAIFGRTTGTSFVDISNPASPVYLGNLPSHTVGANLWRDMRVYGNHAYIGSEASGHGLQIFDLTQLRNVVNPPVTFVETAHYNGFGNSHTLAVNEETGFLYAVGTNTCSGGLHMLNLSNPASPAFAGCFATDGYTHETQCWRYRGPDAAYQGREVCFNSNEDTLTIVDVQNKTIPAQLSRTTYPGVGYTHQGWLTDDHRYFLLDDELDERNSQHNGRTYIWDVSDLNAPQLIGNFTANNPAIDHNLYIKGRFSYHANYRAGFRMLDLKQVSQGQLSEYGYFDIYPADNNPSFNAAWNNYPFFNSGVVILSGIEQGLFILKPRATFEVDALSTAVNICGNGSEGVQTTISPLFGYTGSNLTLSLAGLPAGALGNFGTLQVTPPATTTLTLGAGSAAAGAYPLTIRATDGTITQTDSLTLNLASAAPGAVQLSSPSSGASGVALRPTLQWAAATQGVTYELQVASDAAFNTLIATAQVAGTSYTLTGDLDSDTIYYWRVRALNVCGMGGWSATASFGTVPGPGDCTVANTDPRVIYSSSFESGADGWSHTGIGDTWALVGSRFHTGSTAWRATGVATPSDQQLVSPAVTLPANESPLSLHFWNYQSLERRTAGGCYDGGIVEISTNNGATWSQITSGLLTDPYDGQLQVGTPLTPMNTVPAWCGDPQDWVRSVIDLTGYAGQTVRFRFRVGTDEGTGREGWFVDDVKVRSCQVNRCPDFGGPVGVGVEDVQAVALHWGQQPGHPEWDSRFDLQADNVIDVVDIMRVTAAWGTTCP